MNREKIRQSFKDIFNWCAQDIKNVAPITIPRLIMYPFNKMLINSAAYPTGAGNEFTDYFCRGARIAERSVTLVNVATAVFVGTAVTGGLGIAAGIGVYCLGAAFGLAAGHKAQGYFRPAKQGENSPVPTQKKPENDWMSPAAKAQYEAAQKNTRFKAVKSLKRKLLMLSRH